MSQDIRKFFTNVSKKAGGSSSLKPSNVSSKPVILIDSGDEDVIRPTPERGAKSVSKISHKRKVHVISSDSDDEVTKKITVKKPKEIMEKLVPVSVDDYFGDKVIKMGNVTLAEQDFNIEQNRPKTNGTRKSKNCELGVHGDKDFDKTLMELDEGKSKKKKRKPRNPELGVHGDPDFDKTLEELDDDFISHLDVFDKTIEEATLKTEDNVKISNNITQRNSPHQETKRKLSDTKDTSELVQHKRQRSDFKGTTPKKLRLEQNDSGIDPDQEHFEKRRYSAMLYQKYLHRGGPKHLGQKELPKGKPDCLKNLTFLRTGVLDSMEGDDFQNFVIKHGGQVVKAVSKKLNYIVVGEDAGPAKLAKARGFNIPEIDEDQLLDLVLEKSGMKAKFSKACSTDSSDSALGSFQDLTASIKKKDIAQNQDPNGNEGKKLENSNSDFKKLRVSSEKNSTTTKKSDIEPRKEAKENGEQERKCEMREKIKPKGENSESKLAQSSEIELPKMSSDSSEEFETQQQSSEILSWTDKYKPKDIKSIIGQQNDSSNMNKLKKWLLNWYRNQQPEVRKKIVAPSPWAKNDDGAYYKAALLSGPPGVGKTTTATLVSKFLGFDTVEFNASDTRSKRLLHEEVAQLLSTTTIAGFALGQKHTTKKRVLLMDEVDGMAGNEDRGGIQELINLIKNTSIPIICMCNDRNHQKMRSLVNYCFDLRFSKPIAKQIMGAMMSICFKENIKINPDALIEVINGTGCDIRQTLNHLSMWSAVEKKITIEMASEKSKNSKKDTIMGPWEVIKAVFNPGNQDTVADKFKLFFYDYSLGPLFVQENYLGVTPKCPTKEIMKRVSAAANAISMGDLVDSKIRGSNNWSLLETQALFSSVLPGHFMSGNITKRINFPGWLGKNSSASKRKRMLGELFTHTRTSTSGGKFAMNLDYLKPLRDAIINPLKKRGLEGVHEAIEIMKAYNLLREDLTNLIELCQWKDTKNPFNDVEAKVKSAFTRAYNKEGLLLPFAPAAGFSKKKATNIDSDLTNEAAYEDSDTEIEDDVGTDTMIKVKTKTETKNKKDSANPSTSKAKKGSSKVPKGRSKKGK